MFKPRMFVAGIVVSRDNILLLNSSWMRAQLVVAFSVYESETGVVRVISRDAFFRWLYFRDPSLWSARRRRADKIQKRRTECLIRAAHARVLNCNREKCLRNF
mmetsp:Transcript_5429/g.6773  ORF Transcript_5429/g.6773 Transcript_5429/m.6773 type:complete len:103 (+) Transcript_5429:1262-1570(+)